MRLSSQGRFSFVFNGRRFWEQELALSIDACEPSCPKWSSSIVGPRSFGRRKIPSNKSSSLEALVFFPFDSILCNLLLVVWPPPPSSFSRCAGLAANRHGHSMVDRVQSSSFMSAIRVTDRLSIHWDHHQVVRNNARPFFFFFFFALSSILGKFCLVIFRNQNEVLSRSADRQYLKSSFFKRKKM